MGTAVRPRESTRPAGHFTSREACRMIGASYRKVDYWRRTTPALEYDGHGSGQPSWVAPDALVVLDLLNRLTAAGISLHRARQIAGSSSPGETIEVDLAPGVVLAVRWRTVEEIRETSTA